MIQFLPSVAEGLRDLHAAGYGLIIVSNQSGIARGLFPESALAGVEARLRQMFKAAGVPLAAFYYCPHHLDGRVGQYAVACICRKPQPGLIFQAAKTLAIDLNKSWLIGDILDDVEAGRQADCQTILIENGHETEWHLSRQRIPQHVVQNFAEAARLVLTLNTVATENFGQYSQIGT